MSLETFKHEAQVLQGPDPVGCLQKRCCAKTSAAGRLPHPSGPENIRAWGTLASFTIFIRRSFADACPMISEYSKTSRQIYLLLYVFMLLSRPAKTNSF